MTPEGEVKEHCLLVARRNGFEPIRLQAGMAKGKAGSRWRLAPNGTPDWLFLRPVSAGMTESFYCELKAPGKLPGAKQLAMHEELTARGFLVTVQDSAQGLLQFMRANFEGIR